MRWREILEVGRVFFAAIFIVSLLAIVAPGILPYIKYLLGWIMIIGFLVAMLAAIVVPTVLLIKSLFS